MLMLVGSAAAQRQLLDNHTGGKPCGGDKSAEKKCAVEVLMQRDDLSTLKAAVMAAGLAGPLADEDSELTIFAPKNSAFEELANNLGLDSPTDLLEDENRDLLERVLKNHVVEGKIFSSDLSDGLQASTLEGDNITVEEEGGAFKLASAAPEAANILEADKTTCNQVIHVIDGVLLPEDA